MENFSFADFIDLFGASVAAAMLAAVMCGLLGVLVVLRRVAFVSAALGQVSGLGVAVGFLLGSLAGLDPHGKTPFYLDPVVIALVLAGGLAVLTSFTSRVSRTSPESMVAFAYITAAALALVVLANPRIIQEAHEVNDLLFGSTVAVLQEHLIELAIVAALVVVTQALFFKDFVFISFDPEMAKTLGVRVTALELGLNLSIGVAVAVATRAVGALPVFGFLVLPAGAALLMVQRLRWVVVLSVAMAVISAAAGIYVSFVENLPAGPMMVVCAAAFWPLAAVIRLLDRPRTS